MDEPEIDAGPQPRDYLAENSGQVTAALLAEMLNELLGRMATAAEVLSDMSQTVGNVMLPLIEAVQDDDEDERSA